MKSTISPWTYAFCAFLIGALIWGAVGYSVLGTIGFVGIIAYCALARS
jgi:ABC-type Fe3+-siderophore transport system permease subunit